MSKKSIPYFSIPNLKIYQHYKNRTPPWIKLHSSILEDYEYACLQDASKLHLILIWVLASRMENKLPYDPVWIRNKIGAKNDVDLKCLRDNGFIEVASDMLAECLQDACVEREREGETEKKHMSHPEKKPSGYDPLFETFWTEYPQRSGSNDKKKAFHSWNARIKEGHQPEEILAGTLRYRSWCDKTGKIGTEMVKMAASFLGPADPPCYTLPWSVPDKITPEKGWDDMTQREKDLWMKSH